MKYVKPTQDLYKVLCLFNAVQFLIFITVPKMPPEGVECQGVTSAGIELKWDLISSENLRGKLSSYKIHYQEVSSLDLKDSK